MDKLRQVARSLRETKDNTNQALMRVYKNQPIIERARDVFDSDNGFEMEFQTPDASKKIDISLLFQPTESIPCPPSTGCFQGYCDFYYNDTDTTLTTTYGYINGTSYVYVNDMVVAHTETGANEVTISSRLVTDRVRVCYVYEVGGCDGCEGTRVTTVIDNFNRVDGSDWGTATIGNSWIFIDDLDGHIASVDGNAGHLSGDSEDAQCRVSLAFTNFATSSASIEFRWNLSDDNGEGIPQILFGNTTLNNTVGFSLTDAGVLSLFRANGGSTVTQTIATVPSYNTGIQFWVAIRLRSDGSFAIKHWAGGTEGIWTEATALLTPASLTPSTVTKIFTRTFGDGAPSGTTGDLLSYYHIEAITQECVYDS